jgi:uncharacterized protein YndB with AHSA1/START domain
MSDTNKSETAAATNSPTVIERTYRASVEELWELWTTKEGFESWWGPDGFRVEVMLSKHAWAAHCSTTRSPTHPR